MIELESLIQMLTVGGVLALSVWDVERIEARARRPRALRRPTGADRCPYCHQPFAQGVAIEGDAAAQAAAEGSEEAEAGEGEALAEPWAAAADEAKRVACAACGTEHHALCWSDHGGCSVFACGGRGSRSLSDACAGGLPRAGRALEQAGAVEARGGVPIETIPPVEAARSTPRG